MRYWELVPNILFANNMDISGANQHRNGGATAGPSSSTYAAMSVLKKEGDGSAFAPWLIKLKQSILTLPNSGVATYGAQILRSAFCLKLYDSL